MSNGNSTAGGSKDDGTIVGLHYKIGKKIGEGSFGVLFEGTNLINGIPVAIKFEPRKTEAPQLKDEYRTYKILAGTPGVPLAYYFGQEGLHNILVIDLLGPSLEDLFDWCGRRFSVKTVVQCAVQMITLIEDLHSHDLIYRDIKPDNFLIGRPNTPDANKIHLIDFGMAKQYRDPKTKQHIPYREKKSLSGTARYMSINTHLGREQSRRDDMEALGHVFFYFLTGQLPWQGLKAPNNKQKYEKIGEKKRTTNVYDLGQGFPTQFARYLEIVRNLAFDETPDYNGYKKLLLSVLDDLSTTMDGEYDWMKLNNGRGWDLTINKKPNLHGYGHPNPPRDKSRRHRNPGKYENGVAPNGLGHGNGAGAVAGVSPGPEPDKPRLDPTSYEAYQQQTQQKYAQQRLQQLQQQQRQHNPLHKSHNNAGPQQPPQMGPSQHTQQPQHLSQPTKGGANAQQQQNMHTNAYQKNNDLRNDTNKYQYQEQPSVDHVANPSGQQDRQSSSSNKGLFSKFSCC